MSDFPQIRIPNPHDERATELKLDDRDMSMLIAGAANHSSKLVLLASMNPDEIYTLTGSNSPKNLFKKSQLGYEQDGWTPDYSAAFGYLTKSLAPVGMVAKEYIDSTKSAVGYRLSEKGERYGIATAGFLLDFAARHELALSQVFGDTTSRNPEARAGEIRWKIFQGLATQQPDIATSIAQLAESIDADSHRTRTNLSELRDIGLVNYEPGTQRPAQEYVVDLHGLRDFLPKMHKSGSAEIARFITKHNDQALVSYTVAELAGLLKEQDPTQNNPIYRAYVKTILDNWVNSGYAQRQVDSSGDALVWVDRQQQALLSELVEILDKIQSGKDDVIDQGKSLAKDIVSNPQIVSRLLSHEKKVSVHFHGQENAQKRGARVLSILAAYGGEMTYDQIEQELKSVGDIVSKNGIARVLKDREDITLVTSRGKQTSVRLNQ